MTEQLTYRGQLEGHNGCNAVATTGRSKYDPTYPVIKLLLYEFTGSDDSYGTARRRLCGHSHFVEDVIISSDGQFVLSGSWDGTLRLWNLSNGQTTRRFVGHSKDVLSVAFSKTPSIVSGSRDKT